MLQQNYVLDLRLNLEEVVDFPVLLLFLKVLFGIFLNLSNVLVLESDGVESILVDSCSVLVLHSLRSVA